MRGWIGLVLVLLCLTSLCMGQWCFSGFLASNPERDLLSFVPVGNTTAIVRQTVWASSPKTILATSLEPTKRYLYLISADLHHQAYSLEKYSLESGVQIQSRVLFVPAGVLYQGVPFCVSSSAVSLVYDGALHRFSLSSLQEQRQNLPLVQDEVWLACSANTTFVSVYERNQVWFVDANGPNGFMTETPLFIPSPTGLFYEPEQDILFVASGRPLVEIYSYAVGQRAWMATSLLSHLTNDTVDSMQTSDNNMLDGVVLTSRGSLIEVGDGSAIEVDVQTVLPSNDANEFFTVSHDSLVSKPGDWNNKGNLGSLDFISVKPCVANLEKMFLKSNQSLGLFRISPVRGEAIFLDGFDLDQGSALLGISGSCPDPLFWWTDENQTMHIQSSQTGDEEEVWRVQRPVGAHQFAAYDANTWCFVGGQPSALSCTGLTLPTTPLADFELGRNQRATFLFRNMLLAMWDDIDGQGVYSSVLVSSNWTKPVWLAPSGQLLEMERVDEWIIAFRTNRSGIFLMEPGQDQVFYFSLESQLFPYPLHDQGLGVCLNFTSIVLPVEPPAANITQSPAFIGSLPLFIVSVSGMLLCCTTCLFLGCFLSFYRTKKAMFKSANFRYRQHLRDPEREGKIDMRHQFGKHVRGCMWGCLGKCNKNWRDKAEMRMQDRQYNTDSMRSTNSNSLLLRAEDFRDPHEDGEEMMDIGGQYDSTTFDTIPLGGPPSSYQESVPYD